MKRIVLVVFTLALFLCLASCGANNTPSTESSQPQAAAPSAPAPAIAQETPVPATAAEPSPAPLTIVKPAVQKQPSVQEAPLAQAQVPVQPQPAAQPQAANAQENDEISASANGFTIEVLSAETSKDYNGNDIILVKYLFTNTNSTSSAFWQTTDQTVKQNGQNLSPEGIACDDPSFMNSYSQISGGQSIVCAYPYPLLSALDPLDVTVSIYNYNSGTTISSASGRIFIG